LLSVERVPEIQPNLPYPKVSLEAIKETKELNFPSGYAVLLFLLEARDRFIPIF
jgi:hypothetical protein